MSKRKSKKPEVGKNFPNPFEQFDSKKRIKEFKLERNNRNKSKFIKKFKDSDLIHDHSSKKTRKLQLYNLNEPITLTHKNKPLEYNYESDIEHSSEEDFDFKGDYSNIAEAYKEYKYQRELNKKDKEEQKKLLSKLDKEFEKIDTSEFYKPPKSSKENFKSENKLDNYESNLRDLQFNRSQTGSVLDLAKEYRTSRSISSRCQVVERIIKSDTSLPDFAEEFLKGYFESFLEYLEQEDLSNFTKYLDTYSEGLLHLTKKNYKEYKSVLEEELLKVESQQGDLRKYLLIYLVVKTVELNTEIYKFTLLLLEKYLVEFYKKLESKDTIEKKETVEGKLLLLTAYNCIVETGYYIAYFYHVSVKLCTVSNVDQDLVLLVLKAIKITLNALLKNNCNIESVLSQVIVPSLERIKTNFEKETSDHITRDTGSPDNKKEDTTGSSKTSEEKQREFTDLTDYIESLSNIKYPLKSLDIYSSQKLKVEYPKLKTNKFDKKVKTEGRVKGEKYSKKGEKREREEYKNLKRLLLQESLKKAEYNSQKRAKQRLDTERRYREVVRKAMVEQDTLKKLATSSKFNYYFDCYIT